MTVAGTPTLPPGEEPSDTAEKRVSPLELFFDLVFVFALTQVTKLMSDNPTWEGLGQGILVLAALWWAWGAYAWLTNYIAADEGVERLLMFAVMGAFLIAALAVPQAFGSDALVFAIAYAVARWLHIFIFAEANDDIDAGMAVRRLARTALPAPALLICATSSTAPPRPRFGSSRLRSTSPGPYVFGVRGFRVSAGHFAERFSLIVIIALGESIVAIGAGLEGELDAGVIVAATLGLVVACSLWWAYFDVVALVSERRFREAQGLDQVAHRARLLQLPAPPDDRGHRADRARDEEDGRARRRAAQDRAGGRAVRRDRALLRSATSAFRLRNVHTLNVQRLVAALLCLALIPLVPEVDALVALAVAAAITSGLVAYEAVRFAESRRRLRAAVH